MSAATWYDDDDGGRYRPPFGSRRAWLVSGLVALGLALLVGYFGVWRWMVCRIEVPPGHSLSVRYKGPFPPFLRSVKSSEGKLVKLNSWGLPEAIGVLEEMPGPGRHFFSPWEYECKLVKDTVIEPGQVGIVTSRVGAELPPGQILADEDGYKGIWRRVLTPGRYRLNTEYAYTVTPEPATTAAAGTGPKSSGKALIPPGYVGVVTNKAEDPANGQTKGIQDAVLQPGIYWINQFEKKIDIVSVGYNEFTLNVLKQPPPEAPDPPEAPAKSPTGTAADFVAEPDPIYVPSTGIDFPSADGFQIHLDFTAIWGVLPEQAPGVIRRFGTLDDVKTKVIQPQIGSVCRIYGSKRGAVELLVGDSREKFQNEAGQQLAKALEEKDLSLLFGLARHIYVPAAVREPIQRSKIADELKKTRDQEQETAKAQAELTEAIAKVILEEKRTQAETGRLVAEAIATGEKEAREIEATTEKIKAAINAQAAEIDAKTATTIGEATAKKTELSNRAEAERFGLYVKALGSSENYNRYQFAEKLPADLNLGIFYAGPGTFWTDLKGFQEAVIGKMAADQQQQPQRPLPAAAPAGMK